MASFGSLYKSLPLTTQDSVRVLCITKKGVSLHEDLVCELRTVKLADNPEFDAISCAPGGTSSGRKLQCNGHEVQISDNAYAALAQLQNVKRNLTVWFPSVCVDQSSESERQHHAALASKLYSTAQNTYIWLGVDSSTTIEAMTFMSASRGLRHVFYKQGDSALGLVQKPIWIFLRLFVYPYILTLPKNDVCLNTRTGRARTTRANLTELLSSSWCTSTESLRDAVLATNPILVHSNHYIPWVDFATTLVYLYHTTAYDFHLRVKLEYWLEIIFAKDHVNAQQNFDIKGSSRGPLTKCAQALREVSTISRRVDVASSWISTLLSLAIIILVFKTTWMPHFVQGHQIALLLGYALFVFRRPFSHILPDRNESLSRFSRVTPLRDDYALENLCSAISSRCGGNNSRDSYHAVKGILEVLLKRDLPFVNNQKDADRELTVGLLEATGSLGIILKAAQSSTGSPSWAPNWADNAKHVLDHSKRTKDLNATLVSNRPRGMVVNRPTLELPEALVVSGVHLHKVTQTYTLQSTEREYYASEHEIHLNNYWIMHDLVIASNTKAKEGSVEGAKLSYVTHTTRSQLSGFITPELIILLNSVWAYRTATELTEEDLVAYVKHFIPGKDDVDVSAMLTTPTAANPLLSWPESVRKLFRVHMVVCRAIRKFDLIFFRASIPSDYAGPLWSWIDKDCMGICTNLAKVGDEIVLVEGLPIPFIMRPAGGKYSLVSLAYVFNMMQGQAWQYKDVSGGKPAYVHNRQHQITII